MKTIVNVDQNLGLGREGELLVNIPEDMRFFREETLGRTVIMGRKTLLSFPGARPLKHRINIVLTRDASLIPEESRAAADIYIPGYSKLVDKTDAVSDFVHGSDRASRPTILITATSKDEIFDILTLIYGEGETNEAYIIGGASIYSLFLDDCDTLLVTENDAGLEADKHFPDFHLDPRWVLTQKSTPKEYEGIHFAFCRYERAGMLMLYKPKGVRLCSLVPEGFFPIAGLDKDAEGLVLLTDSQDLALRQGKEDTLMERTYFVELDAPSRDEEIKRIESSALITRLSDRSFFVTVYRERYHLVRELMRPTGRRVMSLKRVSLASVPIDPLLTPGMMRPLTPEEAMRLKEI